MQLAYSLWPGWFSPSCFCEFFILCALVLEECANIEPPLTTLLSFLHSIGSLRKSVGLSVLFFLLTVTFFILSIGAYSLWQFFL